MDVRREFAKRPPREELTSLAALVRDWKWRTAPGGGLDVKRDDIVDYCKAAPDFRTAVYRACVSIRPNGKMHGHQTKVSLVARMDFAEKIIGVWRHDWWKFHAWGFDRWFDALEELAPRGIGPVTLYDVSVRTGAFIGIKPKDWLYLHAGALDGWKAMMGPLAGRARYNRVRRMDWPVALRYMPADEVEDFLCTYRTLFGGLR